MSKNSDSKNLKQYCSIFDLMQKNEFEKAFSISKKIMEEDFSDSNDNENTLRFYNNFLWLCYKLEKYAEGSQWADKLQEAARKNPYIYHHMACLYVKTGQLKKAIEQVGLAFKYRYQEIENMLNDKDLGPLFKDKEFQAIKNKSIMTKEALKKIIFEAFKDVSKGEGIGARECVAEDDWASDEEKEKIRFLDIEKHWWEYPRELVENGNLDYSLGYNNKDGVKFHLPALMTADIDGFGNTADISVFYTLCLENFKRRPHHGHKEYVDFMKSVNVLEIIKYYDFSSPQIHAIALYFLFDRQRDESYNDTRDEIIESIKNSHERSIKYGGGEKNYNLSLEDAIKIKDEERRILADWFKVGRVEVGNVIFLNSIKLP